MLEPAKSALAQYFERLAAEKISKEYAELLAKRQARLRRQGLVERQAEDIQYLRQAGVIAVFYDAARIMKRYRRDVAVHVDQPTTERDIRPNVTLRWDFQKSQEIVTYRDRWTAQSVICHAVRSDESLVGVSFNPGYPTPGQIVNPLRKDVSAALNESITHGPVRRLQVDAPKLSVRFGDRFVLFHA